jgi:serine/threonine protein kinase
MSYVLQPDCTLTNSVLKVRETHAMREEPEFVTACHSISRRDIKPANILVNGMQRVKLCDFGLARLAKNQQTLAQTASQYQHSTIVTGKLAGTLHYLAPELQNGGRPGPACDLYALGGWVVRLVLCHCLGMPATTCCRHTS